MNTFLGSTVSHIKSIVVFLILGSIIFSCEGTRKEDSKNGTAIKENNITPVTDVVTAYILLKDAFVATDYEAAKVAAGTLKEVVPGNVDAAFEKALLSVTDSIISAGNVGEQRERFEQLSILMYALAENGQFEGRTIYKQFCPMAFDNKGAYWLSLDENILNPYFGDKMLRCGYVEEIL